MNELLHDQIKDLQERVTRLEHLIQNIQRVTGPMQILGEVTTVGKYCEGWEYTIVDTIK